MLSDDVSLIMLPIENKSCIESILVLKTKNNEETKRVGGVLQPAKPDGIKDRGLATHRFSVEVF